MASHREILILFSLNRLVREMLRFLRAQEIWRDLCDYLSSRCNPFAAFSYIHHLRDHHDESDETATNMSAREQLNSISPKAHLVHVYAEDHCDVGDAVSRQGTFPILRIAAGRGSFHRLDFVRREATDGGVEELDRVDQGSVRSPRRRRREFWRRQPGIGETTACERMLSR